MTENTSIDDNGLNDPTTMEGDITALFNTEVMKRDFFIIKYSAQTRILLKLSEVHAAPPHLKKMYPEIGKNSDIVIIMSRNWLLVARPVHTGVDVEVQASTIWEQVVENFGLKEVEQNRPKSIICRLIVAADKNRKNYFAYPTVLSTRARSFQDFFEKEMSKYLLELAICQQLGHVIFEEVNGKVPRETKIVVHDMNSISALLSEGYELENPSQSKMNSYQGYPLVQTAAHYSSDSVSKDKQMWMVPFPQQDSTGPNIDDGDATQEDAD